MQIHQKVPRAYYLPIRQDCLSGCSVCQILGCQNEADRSEMDIQRALERAVSGEFDTIVFPAHLLLSPLRQRVLELCFERRLKVIIQIHWNCLTERVTEKLFALLNQGCGLNLIFDVRSRVQPEKMKSITSATKDYYFTLVVQRDPIQFLRQLSEEARGRLHLYFPLPCSQNLDCERVQRIIQRIRGKFPEMPIHPPKAVEIWDPRVQRGLSLEPTAEAKFEFALSETVQPIISVIIPTYENKKYLIQTVRHLLRQDFPPEDYEIIVVDDGSSDATGEALQKELRLSNAHVNLRYYFSPRPAQRKMGDASFRAGVTRNLGVKHARGELLCFVDSDILTPQNYLSTLWKLHQSYDVVQVKRYDLPKEISHRGVDYEQLALERDVVFSRDGYWETFFETANWQSLPFFWKYVCTYGLSLRAELFKRVGWFKRTFIYYGFEDTELGYRLAKFGCRFHLADLVTFHLHHSRERSEYDNLAHKRHALLKETAQIFYLNCLDPEVFEHFSGLLKSGRWDWLTRHFHHEYRWQPPFGEWPEGTDSVFNANPFARFYHLPVMNTCRESCDICEANGCFHDQVRSIESLKSHLECAVNAKYQYVVFPPNFVDYPYQELALKLSQNLKLQPIVQMYQKFGWPEQSRILNWKKLGAQFEILFTDELHWYFVRRMREWLNSILHLTLIPSHQTNALDVVAGLPTWMGARLCLFSPITGFADRLSTDELFDFAEDLKIYQPQIEVRPYRPFDIWNPRIDTSETIEPIQSSVVYQSTGPKPELSIVIPHFESSYLGRCLDAILNQDYDANLFEIIVVDDGSKEPLVESLDREKLKDFNFRYIYWSRSLCEKQSFRAGRARQIGAQWARTDKLLFLDSDIEIPVGLLRDVAYRLENCDVVQYGRVNDHSYWLQFYDNELSLKPPSIWKYTSTSCLGIQTRAFWQVGGFAAGFDSYGMEDTLLGYKLNLLGLKWQVGQLCVTHLRPKKWQDRLIYFKYKRMAKSARVFYHATLNRDFYLAFFPALGEWHLMRWALHLSRQYRMGRFLARIIYFPLLFLRAPFYALPLILLAVRNSRPKFVINTDRCAKPVAAVTRAMKTLITTSVEQVRAFIRAFKSRLARLWQQRPSYWKMTYPLRKIYYFIRYQIQTRIRRKREPTQ